MNKKFYICFDCISNLGGVLEKKKIEFSTCDLCKNVRHTQKFIIKFQEDIPIKHQVYECRDCLNPIARKDFEDVYHFPFCDDCNLENWKKTWKQIYQNISKDSVYSDQKTINPDVNIEAL